MKRNREAWQQREAPLATGGDEGPVTVRIMLILTSWDQKTSLAYRYKANSREHWQNRPISTVSSGNSDRVRNRIGQGMTLPGKDLPGNQGLSSDMKGRWRQEGPGVSEHCA